MIFRRRDWKAIRRNMAEDGPAFIVKQLMWSLFPFVMLVFLLGAWKDRRKDRKAISLAGDQAK